MFFAASPNSSAQANIPLSLYGNLSEEIGNAGVWFSFLGSNKIWWSETMFNLFGLPPANGIDLARCRRQIHPQDLNMVRNRLDAILFRQSHRLFYRVIVNSRVRWMEENAYLYCGDQSDYAYIIGFIRGISEPDQTQKILARRELLPATTDCWPKNGHRTSWQTIADTTKQCLKKVGKIAQIALFPCQNGMLQQHTIPKNLDIKTFANTLFPNDGVEKCWQRQHPILITESKTAANDRQLLKQCQVMTIVHWPVYPVGVIALGLKDAIQSNQKQTLLGKLLQNQLKLERNNHALYKQIQLESSERKKVQAHLNTIFNESIDFITVLNKDGTLQKTNPAMAKTLGYSKEELLSDRIGNLIHPDDRPQCPAVLQKIIDEGLLRGYRNRFICKNGDILHLEWNATYSKENDCIIGICRDITRQVETEASNRELERSVSLEKMKTEFFSELSHEFKTPLNIILSSLQLLKIKLASGQEAPCEGYEKFLRYMELNSYKLLRLSSNLIDLTKIDNGFIHMALGRYPTEELIEEIVDSVRDFTTVKGIELKCESNIKDTPYLDLDQDKFDRILLNLISNAIKNTPKGGQIQISVGDTADDVKISVKDNGTGIAPQFLPFIFDKFHGTQDGFTRNCDGSGIGLSIAKSLVEMHQGQITVKSKVNHGSTFAFTISKHLAQTRPNPPMLCQKQYHNEQRNNRILMEMSEVGLS